MFPRHPKHKQMLQVVHRDHCSKDFNKWVNKRFNGYNSYLIEGFDKHPEFKENSGEFKIYLDKIGYCEYCESYVGVSPNIRKLKNIGSISGCCIKNTITFATKYNDICFSWKAKKFWEDILVYKMKKMVIKLCIEDYPIHLDEVLEQVYQKEKDNFNADSKAWEKENYG